MKTERLYEQDAYLTQFRATVRACTPAPQGWEVVLDRTAFYPEGGGQPADHGVLCCDTGEAAVRDVHAREGEIVHFCTAPLESGAEVRGRIDWERRFDHMQQHSGEHICSGMICETCHCDNVGFHMGAEITTIDFNAEIDWETLIEVEQRANRYIYENHAVEIATYRAAELNAISYRSKKALEGDVRIVRFPGADCCACCGTHVSSSGQVGIVKFLSCQAFRNGVRIELLCGARAYRYLSKIWEQNQRVAQSLSAKPTESASAVRRLEEEHGALKLRAARDQDKLILLTASRFSGAGNVLLIERENSPSNIQKRCSAIADACGGTCAVFSGKSGAWRYALEVPEGTEAKDKGAALNAALHGRGGGRGRLIQGSAACTIKELKEYFRDYLIREETDEPQPKI